MTEQIEVRQSVNEIGIVGKIKEKKVNTGLTKKNLKYVSVRLTIEVKEGDKIHNFQVEKFAQANANSADGGKFYKMVQTYANDYKEGDLIKVSASMDINDYYNGEGELVSFPKYAGNFFNRIELDENGKPTEEGVVPKAEGKVEVYIQSIEDEMGLDDLPTGRLLISGFTVGYGAKMIPVTDLVVAENLAEPVKKIYKVGDTAVLSLKLENYAEVSEVEIEEEATMAFGQEADVETTVTRKYKRESLVLGGAMPKVDGTEYQAEDVEELEKKRKLALQEAQERSKNKPKASQDNSDMAFGASSSTSSTATSAPLEISADDVPW